MLMSELHAIAQARAGLPDPQERRRIRLESGVSLRTLAAHLGMSVASFAALEKSGRINEKYLVKYYLTLELLKKDPAEPALTAEEAQALRDQWEQEACGACGGLHTTAIKAPGSCPRIRKITYDSQGRMLEVEYWPDGRWPRDGIVWPDEIVAGE